MHPFVFRQDFNFMDYRFHLQNKSRLERETYLIKPSSGHIRACAVYPNHYELAMSSLSFHFLYETLNSYPELLVERAFLPDKKDTALAFSKYLPSFESATPLNNFNILAFSVSYEADFINILRILKMSRMPFSRKEREDNGYPLLIMGGPVALQNIIPVNEIFDIIALSSGEICLNNFIASYLKLAGSYKNANDINSKIVNELAGQNNFYIPKIHKCSKTTIIKTAITSRPRYARTVILTPETEFSSRALVEAVRGCVRRCKFCMVGNCYGKFKYNKSEDIISYIEQVSEKTKKIGLLGPAVSAHPSITELCKHFKDKGCDVSMSSIYINEISDELISLLSQNEQKNITLGIESADYEIRKACSKNFTDDEIFENIDKALSCGISGFKLYLMLGLYDYFGKNGELEASETANFVLKINERILSKKRDARLKVSINPLILKPRTPMHELFSANDEFMKLYENECYIEKLEKRYKMIANTLKSSSGVEFSEKSFADAELLKYINECNLNLFDFFDDFFYNESRNARAIVKIFSRNKGAFNMAGINDSLFNARFEEI